MVGIVILNYNNSAQTLKCLDSLYSCCTGGNYRVCIVDNASTESEKVRLSEICTHGEHVIYAAENGGYARGNNLGCEWFDGLQDIDKILILNDDTRFTMDIISPLEAYIDSHPGCGVVFPLVLSPSGSIDRGCARKSKSTRDLVIQATRLERLGIVRDEFIPLEQFKDKDEIMTQVPPGCCMMLRKSVFREAGWFDPNTFLYFEEHILGEKLKRAGLGCILLPQVSIIHLGAQTTGGRPSSEIYGHWRHSYLYFIRNYTDMPAALRLFVQFRTWLKKLI